MQKCLFLALICLLIAPSTFAQDSTVHFTQQQIAGFEKQAVQYVKNFCAYLGDLSSSETPADYKPQLKKNLSRLFVPGATIEVKSVSRPGKSKSYTVAAYADLVAGYAAKFKFVVLQFYNVRVDVKHLKDTIINGQKYYCGTFSYWQRFLASNEEKESNNYIIDDFIKAGADETRKTGIICYQELSSGLKTERWRVFLGDIHAKEVKPLKAR